MVYLLCSVRKGCGVLPVVISKKDVMCYLLCSVHLQTEHCEVLPVVFSKDVMVYLLCSVHLQTEWCDVLPAVFSKKAVLPVVFSPPSNWKLWCVTHCVQYTFKQKAVMCYLLGKGLKWCHIDTTTIWVLGKHSQDSEFATDRLTTASWSPYKHVIHTVVDGIEHWNSKINRWKNLYCLECCR